VSAATDAGLRFFATITYPDGREAHRETPSRRELLEWLAAHGAAGTVTAVSMEATGPAIPNMLGALVLGAQALEP
jgi:hypothetical protein